MISCYHLHRIIGFLSIIIASSIIEFKITKINDVTDTMDGTTNSATKNNNNFKKKKKNHKFVITFINNKIINFLLSNMDSNISPSYIYTFRIFCHFKV